MTSVVSRAHAALFVVCVVASWLVTSSLASSRAEAQTLELHVPDVCATEASVRARLASFGIEHVDDATITITTSTSWSGLVRGELHLAQRGVTAVRSLEDVACEDVVAALVIAAALALREGLGETAPALVTPDTLELHMHETETGRPGETAPTGTTMSLAVGLEGRLGLGPVPGLSVAPGIVGRLSIDAFVGALHVVYWPSSMGTGDGSRALGASVRAFVATVEAGGRVGDDIGVTVTGVIEVGAAISRGVGIAEPSDVASAVLDGGLAVAMDGRVGPVTWFLRLDLLFAIAQPVYLVGDYAAFEAPPLRGSLSVGALVSPN